MNSFTNYTKTFFQTIFDIFWKKKVEFVFILLIPIYRYKKCFWLGWLSQLNFRCLILAQIMISASWDLPTQGPQVQLPAQCGVYFFHSLCLAPAPLVLSLFQISKTLKKKRHLLLKSEIYSTFISVRHSPRKTSCGTCVFNSLCDITKIFIWVLRRYHYIYKCCFQTESTLHQKQI